MPCSNYLHRRQLNLSYVYTIQGIIGAWSGSDAGVTVRKKQTRGHLYEVKPCLRSGTRRD